jgi:integrase
LKFHDLRRSALTAMEEAGVSRKLARHMSGHKTEAVYLRYVIVGERAIDQAAALLEAHHATILAKTGQSKWAKSPPDGTIQ